MSSSELSEVSSLSSAQSIETDEEILNPKSRPGTLDQWLKRPEASPSPPPKKREPSPPHEYVLADNPNIAFIVMFRARFGDAFPRSCPQFGPQDIEQGVDGELPDENVDKLTACLVGLVLNRKKEVDKNNYTRALEEAITANHHQWPKSWAGNNPLHGGKTFQNITAEQRLNILHALVLWALCDSEAIKDNIIKTNYKGNRDKEDVSSGLQVQPWGQDGYKRRYWMIEGRDDTHFRIYRESNPVLKTNTWWSVADSIPTARELATKLAEDGTRASKRLHDSILGAIPRLEAGEDKRKRREYRVARKQQFRRPAPGFSIYEGRTRGKRVRYTFSDEEDESDERGLRRSGRTTGISTPNEIAMPTVTASGRQVKSRIGGTYGEIPHSGQQAEIDAARADEQRSSAEAEGANGRHMRNRRSSGTTNGRSTRDHRYNSVDGMEDESDAESSGNEWDGGDDDEDDDMQSNKFSDEDEDADVSDLSGDEDDGENTNQSLLVKLKVTREKQEELCARNGEKLRMSEPPLECITVAPKVGQSSPSAADANNSTSLLGSSLDGTQERVAEPDTSNGDKMDDVQHTEQQAQDGSLTHPLTSHAKKGHPSPVQAQTAHAPSPHSQSGPNGLAQSSRLPNGNVPSIVQLDGATDTSFVPLSPDTKTKLPFSPKRESPPKLAAPSMSSTMLPLQPPLSNGTTEIFAPAASNALTTDAHITNAPIKEHISASATIANNSHEASDSREDIHMN